MDLTIEGKTYLKGMFERCCIGIREGKIVAVKKILKSDVHFDFGNKLILPGGIDLHVHFRDPGFQYKEDFSTGSQAAAFGGITCVFDMPNTSPPTTTQDAILNKIRVAEKKSFVDFGVYAAVTDNNIEDVNKLSKDCNGFKIYLGGVKKTLKLSRELLEKTLKLLDKTGSIALIHAVSGEHMEKGVEHSLKDHLRRCPPECEEVPIRNILDICRDVSSKIHICHLSSSKALQLLKKRPRNISVGVTPHHLLFDIHNVGSKQALYKVNPPIRSGFDREALWDGVNKGYIDVLESDHAPHTLDEKEIDFDTAPSGVPGVETMYPLFLALVKKEKMSFDRLIHLLCEKPAEITGIPKGKIEIGMDADLTIFEFKEIKTIKSDVLHSKCNWTPFEGKPAIFPQHVFLRGERIIEDYELVADSGVGKKVTGFT
jgi:dihydroorotase